jgi:hypothetical protein
MKTLKVGFLTVIMIFTFSLTGAFAEGLKIGGSASVGVFSNYVWRGQKLSNSFVIQPSVSIAYNNFSVNVWSNLDSDYSDNFEHTETDFTLEYAFSMDRFNFNVGYIYYGLESATDTQELYFSVGYDIMLSPSLTVYYDFDEGEGGFVVASIGHSLTFPSGMVLNLGASASYNLNNEVMGYDNNGDEFSNFYNGEVSASLSIPLGKAFTLEPMVAYSFPLSSDAEDAIGAISDDGDKDILYTGVTLSFSF